MKRNTMTIAHSVAMILTTALIGMSNISALAQTSNKQMNPQPQAKQTKTAAVVKYKAQCGMIYSAADAKKYHYICPMDHKPLTKIASSKSGHQKK